MAFQLLNPFVLAGVLFFTLLAFVFIRERLPTLFKPPVGHRRPWQCRLTDIYILLFQLCVSGWLTYEPDEEYGPLENIEGLAILWSLQSLWWYWGVRYLSWNGVTDSLRRLAVLGIVFPLLFCWPLVNCMCSMYCPPVTVIAAIPLLVYMYCAKFVVAWALASPVELSRWRRLGWIIWMVLFLAATPFVTAPMWCGFSMMPIYYKIQVRRFRKEMRWTANVPAIQAWLKSTDVSQWKEASIIPREKLPACVRWLDGYSHITQENTLVISNGGGFCHWGMEIASPRTTKPGWSSRKYSLPLSDGAWV